MIVLDPTLALVVAQAAPAGDLGVGGSLAQALLALSSAAGGGGVAYAAFRWLAVRDDRREAERAAEREMWLRELREERAARERTADVLEQVRDEIRAMRRDLQQRGALLDGINAARAGGGGGETR